jgi:hypothetical protein
MSVTGASLPATWRYIKGDRPSTGRQSERGWATDQFCKLFQDVSTDISKNIGPGTQPLLKQKGLYNCRLSNSRMLLLPPHTLIRHHHHHHTLLFHPNSPDAKLADSLTTNWLFCFLTSRLVKIRDSSCEKYSNQQRIKAFIEPTRWSLHTRQLTPVLYL